MRQRGRRWFCLSEAASSIRLTSSTSIVVVEIVDVKSSSSSSSSRYVVVVVLVVVVNSKSISISCSIRGKSVGRRVVHVHVVLKRNMRVKVSRAVTCSRFERRSSTGRRRMADR